MNIQSSSPQRSADGKLEVKFRGPQNISGAFRGDSVWNVKIKHIKLHRTARAA